MWVTDNLYPSLEVHGCGKNYAVEIWGLRLGHSTINAFQIDEVGKVNADSAPLAIHRHAHLGVQELRQQTFQFQKPGGLQ